MSTCTCDDDGVFIVQSPDDDLDYALSWIPFLQLIDEDTIATSTWDVPEDLEVHTRNSTSTSVTFWVKGGEAGVEYHVVNRITTAQNRVKDQVITVTITDH